MSETTVNACAMLAQGKKYLADKRYDDAARTLRRYLALPTALWKDDRCACMRALADCYARVGNRAEAERWHLRSCAESPQTVSAWTNAARFYADECAWDMVCTFALRAVTQLERANSAQDSTLPYALLALGLCRNGRTDEARAMLRRACTRHPENAELQKSLRLLCAVKP